MRRPGRDGAEAGPRPRVRGRAAVYARIGTCTQEFGTLASWLVDVINVLTGNLDREGGDAPAGRGRPVELERRVGTRPRGALRTLAEPRTGSLEVLGELPVACLAEEIEAPGEGQIRAILTIAGNPALSTPNSERLQRALGTLDLVVSVDMYLNETTRNADVILPVLPARAEPLRPGVHAARGTQLRQLLPAGHPTGGRRPRRVGDPPSSGRDRRRPGPDPDGGASTGW